MLRGIVDQLFPGIVIGRYYNTGPTATTEEEALKQVHDNANASGIPFSYILLDSWWYYKGVGNGVKNWTATPDTFPNGLANFNNYTRWPVVGHNRYVTPS